MTRRKFLCLLLVGLFVLVVLASSAFLALEAEHDCSGDDCHVCFTLNLCRDLSRYLALVLSCAVTAFVIHDALRSWLEDFSLRDTRSDLITLHVKLSH